MADKRIDELEAASAVTSNDLFVLEQASTAKKLEAQTLENWLLAMAQGRGGIISIAKTGSTGTDPVVDTYTITFSDTSTTTFTVTNGLKGDTGDQTYVYIKYSTRDPIADTDMTDTPSPWMGICSTTSSTAPTTYTSYTWYEIKGDKGDKGDNITISSTSVTYQEWSSGTQYPTGSWLPNPPQVTQGNYLWTRTIVNYSDGGQTVSYSVARNGLDGTGAVSSVCNQLPDNNGNVALSYADVGALPSSYQPPVTSVNNKTGTVVLDNEDVKAKYAQSVSASLSTAGWYRAVKYTASNANDANGYSGAIVHLDLSRSYVNAANEAHSIDLELVSGKIAFIGEKSVSNTLGIDKVRYTKNGSLGYIDVHYNLSSANKVSVSFVVGADDTEQKKFTAETLQSVNDAPSGETIVTTSEFSEVTRTLVKTGISNGWDYALYSDKTIEATKKYSYTQTYYTTVNGFYGYYRSAISTPFTMSGTDYFIGAEWSIGSGFSLSAGVLGKTSTEFSAYALATYGTANADVRLQLYITGKIA